MKIKYCSKDKKRTHTKITRKIFYWKQYLLKETHRMCDATGIQWRFVFYLEEDKGIYKSIMPRIKRNFRIGRGYRI